MTKRKEEELYIEIKETFDDLTNKSNSLKEKMDFLKESIDIKYDFLLENIKKRRIHLQQDEMELQNFIQLEKDTIIEPIIKEEKTFSFDKEWYQIIIDLIKGQSIFFPYSMSEQYTPVSIIIALCKENWYNGLLHLDNLINSDEDEDASKTEEENDRLREEERTIQRILLLKKELLQLGFKENVLEDIISFFKENMEALEVDAYQEMYGEMDGYKGEDTIFQVDEKAIPFIKEDKKAIPCKLVDWIEIFQDLEPERDDIEWPDNILDSRTLTASVKDIVWLVRKRKEH